MHVAYAHDNMHLAKMLLLKLNGIEVTDDKDPRIDQVKDEDFSAAFVPRGGLVMDAEREQKVLEAQKHEQQRRRRRARDERLRICEQIWENSSRAMQAEKTKVTRRKEAAACVRRKLDMEVRERERAKEREREEVSRAVRPVLYSTGSMRPVLSFNNLAPAAGRTSSAVSRSPPKPAYKGPLFDYPFVPAPTTCLSSPSYKSMKSSKEGPYRELTALTNRSVPFSDVVLGMNGRLFPVADEDEQPKKARNIKELELLKTLLQPITWDLGEEAPRPRSTSTKGKARAGVSVDLLADSLVTASPSTSSLASISSSIRRSASWFSFGSRASVTTVITTPSSSPISCTKALPSTLTYGDLPGGSQKHHRLVHTPRSLLTSVAPSETPLGDLRPTPRLPSQDDPLDPRGRLLTRDTLSGVVDCSPSRASTMSFVVRVSQSVSTFVDMAAQFQRAYVKATMSTANPDIYFASYPSSSYSRSRSRSTSRSRTRSSTPRSRAHPSARPRPEGYRACSEDVELFTSTDTATGVVASDRALIPLAYTRPLSTPPPDVPRVFPAPPAIPRSPFRLPYTPDTLTSRLRPVANPLLLRMRALQNLCRTAAGAQVPEVREKVVGVAWEGIGRSGLIREVTVACA
jgi:hypothetical protein